MKGKTIDARLNVHGRRLGIYVGDKLLVAINIKERDFASHVAIVYPAAHDLREKIRDDRRAARRKLRAKKKGRRK